MNKSGIKNRDHAEMIFSMRFKKDRSKKEIVGKERRKREKNKRRNRTGIQV